MAVGGQIREQLVEEGKGGNLLLDLEKQTGKTVYELFAALYLSEHLTNIQPDGTRTLCKNATMHGEMCKLYRNENRVLVVAPAKFAKSTWTSFVQPLADMVLGLVEGDMLEISNTGRLAEHWISLIKSEIEYNKDIIHDFGDMKGDTWRQDFIKAKNGRGIVSLGLNYQIRGTGWGKVIGDDLENDDMCRSEEQREKFSDWFDGALMGRMHPHTIVNVTGTFLHPLCKIKKIYDNTDGQYSNWKRKKYQALDENGNSIWEDRWSTEVVNNQRIEMGEKMFLAEKMNAPIFGQDHIYRPEWIKYYDTKPENLYIITWVDPSSGKLKEVGDYTALEVWGKDLEKENYYLLALNRARIETFSKAKMCLDYNQMFHPVMNCIPNDAYGIELRNVIVKEADGRGQYFPHRLVKETKNKIERAQKVSDLWEKGKVWLPKNIASRMVDELLMFPFGDFDDTVDCQSGALEHLRHIRKRPANRRQTYRVELKPNKAGRLC